MWHCNSCTAENNESATECHLCFGSKDDTREVRQCPHCCLFYDIAKTECPVCNLKCLHREPDTELQPAASQRQRPDDAAGVNRVDIDWTGREVDIDRLSGDGCSLGAGDCTENVQVWVCQKKEDGVLCGGHNRLDVYHCWKCNADKPSQRVLQMVTKGMANASIKGHSSKATHNIANDSHSITADASRPPVIKTNLNEAPPATGVAANTAPVMGAEALPDFGSVDEEVIVFPDAECRMVLVGKTGNGKSSTANTILGMDGHFTVSPAFSSTTKSCQRHNKHRFGIQLEVIDTPGLFDTDDQNMVATEIIKCLAVMAPGPHAIVLVLRVGVKFTQEEARAIDKIYEMFGVQFLRFLVIVFTHGDILDTSSQTALQDLLTSAPPKLRELVENTRNRYVLFNNKADPLTKNRQVKKLLETIVGLLKVNGGRPYYTSQVFEKVETKMQEREDELRKEFGGQAEGTAGKIKGMGDSGMWRDIARDEVVHGSSFLDKIQRDILPTILRLIEVFGPIVFAILAAGYKARTC